MTSGRAGVDEQAAEKVRAARDLVERKGRRDLGNGDYSVDPGWHTAAELLPVIDSLAAELVSLKDALEAFDEKWYPMLASKVIAEQHEFGHEAAVTAWNQLCRDLRALVDSPAAAREALGRRG